MSADLNSRPGSSPAPEPGATGDLAVRSTSTTGPVRDTPDAPQRPPGDEQPPAQVGVLLVGLAVALVLAGLIVLTSGATPFVLFVVGLALGVTLFHSRFGFTSAWRQLVSVGQGRALRAHMLMLAVACTLFAPILAGGVSLSGSASPSLEPVGISLFVGAFLFGVGMQVGGSCASGTLFAVGSGQSAILITLVGFVVGSVLGAWQFPFWTQTLPAGRPVSLAATSFGYLGAWVVSLAAMAVIAGLTLVLARRRHPPRLQSPPAARGLRRALRGSWPLWVGAVLLAGLNALTLVISGSAWGITSAFALWGSKILDAVGVDVTSWPYWTSASHAASYQAGVLGDITSVMDLGIIVGALLASAAAGAFVLHRRVPLRLATGAVLGGVLMGYGARIAYGCNIGAYFDGIASFSLHGWLWGATAILGTVVGLRLRPLFGLTNPRPSDSVC